jgi:AcrR family transcriptional regulator
MARPATDIQARIIHAARALFLQHGVDGASLRQIATDAETNIGMIYYYFKTKDDLFLGVIEEVYGRFSSDLQAIAEDESPIEARIHKLFMRFAAITDAETQVLRLIVREALVSSERLQRVAARFQAGHIPVMMNMVLGGVRDGHLRSDLHPIALALPMFLLGGFPQLIHRRVTASQLPIAAALPSPEDSARMLLDVLFHGIAGPKHQRKTAGSD